MEDGISIIISTYKTPEYLYECIDSIKSQNVNFNYEILIGVDNCEDTLNHIKQNKSFYDDFRIFYFEENVGTFIIRNNLVDLSKFNYLLFFDSDDLLIDGMLEKIYNETKNHEYIRMKLKNFKMNNNKMIFSTTENSYGVFCISKLLFDKFNAFESWICHSDVEFYERLKYHKVNLHIIPEVIFYRRLHENNLTVKFDTNLKSQLRMGYRKITNSKIRTQNWDNPVKIIKNYYEV